MSDKKLPPRDWVKEPYNTWDTLGAMPVPPLPSDKYDIDKINERLIRMEEKIDRLMVLLEAMGNA